MEHVFNYVPITMGFMTFNVKEKDPTHSVAKELASALIGNRVIVLGFQEIDMSISANIKKSKRICKWEDLLDAEFVRGGTRSSQVAKYMKLASHFMMGIVIIMYIDVQLLPEMHDIEATTVSMGVGKIFGNKGGVAISFCIGSTSYLILNCHLLHGEAGDSLEKRDKQLINLFHHSSVTLCTMKKQDGSVDERNFMAIEQFHEVHDLRFLGFLSTERSALNRKNHENLPIFECYDYIFLLGDLNYRIDRVSKEDQLKTRMLSEEFILTSNSFEEPDVTFPPTYKYSKGGSLVLDREPSWTDRILVSRKYNQGDNLMLNFLKYSSLQDLMFSDHKAVYQVMEVCYRVVVDERVGDCLKQYCGTWDKKTREMHPQISYIGKHEEPRHIIPSRSRLNHMILEFEVVCSKLLVDKFSFNIFALDDDLFLHQAISKKAISMTEVLNYLDTEQQQLDIKRSPMGIILSTYTLAIEISINAPVLLPYLMKIYSVQNPRDLLGKQMSVPLLITINSNSFASCLYKDMVVPFMVEIVNHVTLYKGDIISLLNLPLSSINAATFEILGNTGDAHTTPTFANYNYECVESNDPSVLPLLVKLCKTQPDISDLKLLVEFLGYGIISIDCEVEIARLLVDTKDASDSIVLQRAILQCLVQRLKMVQAGSEKDVVIHRNIAFVISYMRFLRSRNEQLYRAAAAAALSPLFNLERSTLPWPDVLDELPQ